MARVVSGVEYKKYKDDPIGAPALLTIGHVCSPFAFVFLNRVSGHQASALSVQAFKTNKWWAVSKGQHLGFVRPSKKTVGIQRIPKYHGIDATTRKRHQKKYLAWSE